MKLAESNHSAERKELFYWVRRSPINIRIEKNHHQRGLSEKCILDMVNLVTMLLKIGINELINDIIEI